MMKENYKDFVDCIKKEHEEKAEAEACNKAYLKHMAKVSAMMHRLDYKATIDYAWKEGFIKGLAKHLTEDMKEGKAKAKAQAKIFADLKRELYHISTDELKRYLRRSKKTATDKK